MPKDIETELNKQIRKFMWNYEKTDTVNQTQMYASHEKGGKKLLDIETRNKAIHLTWLKAYLNLGPDRATWTFFADAIICKDIPKSSLINDDPESRAMPFIQSWETKSRGSNLPEDLKQMLRLAKEYNVSITAKNPSKKARSDLPIWYHIRSAQTARKLYKTKTAKCLRRKHGIKLVRETLQLLDNVNEQHEARNNCTCPTCTTMRTHHKCTHPHGCISLAATLMDRILPEWDPRHDNGPNGEPQLLEHSLEEGEIIVSKPTQTTSLKDTITIFNETRPTPPTPTPTQPTNTRETTQTRDTITVYTDGACINNGLENATAGSGVWYGDNNRRNSSTRVTHENQTNQTGELTAILIALKDNPPESNLRIISDSKYAIDGLTKHAKEWESHNWMGNQNGDLFKSITAWIRSRNGLTTLKWIKGHDRIKGNEEADKLAGEGARKELTRCADSLHSPPNLTASGATLAEMEQRDLYKYISEKRHIPLRSRAERIVGRIQACTKATFDSPPKAKAVWLATKHKDLTRKTRDFLWKSTQHAYKIGEYWTNIPNSCSPKNINVQVTKPSNLYNRSGLFFEI